MNSPSPWNVGNMWELNVQGIPLSLSGLVTTTIGYMIWTPLHVAFPYPVNLKIAVSSHCLLLPQATRACAFIEHDDSSREMPGICNLLHCHALGVVSFRFV